MSENKVDTKQIGSRINHEHLLEIEDYVHKEKQKGRKKRAWPSLFAHGLFQ